MQTSFPTRFRQFKNQARLGFTLVEMLVAITLISLVASLAMVMMSEMMSVNRVDSSRQDRVVAWERLQADLRQDAHDSLSVEVFPSPPAPAADLTLDELEALEQVWVKRVEFRQPALRIEYQINATGMQRVVSPLQEPAADAVASSARETYRLPGAWEVQTKPSEPQDSPATESKTAPSLPQLLEISYRGGPFDGALRQPKGTEWQRRIEVHVGRSQPRR